ncbi:MAG: 50S ribosomal protein L17 [Planctomycetota bacterium]
MRHRVAGRKLNRTPAHRRALARSLIRSLFTEFGKKGYIVTTRVKAKFAQPKAEKLITIGRTRTLHNVRRAMAVLQDREIVRKLFDEIGPHYTSRPGGYTRVIRLSSNRLGDNATRAYFGFVHDDPAEEGDGEAAADS